MLLRCPMTSLRWTAFVKMFYGRAVWTLWVVLSVWVVRFMLLTWSTLLCGMTLYRLKWVSSAGDDPTLWCILLQWWVTRVMPWWTALVPLVASGQPALLGWTSFPLKWPLYYVRAAPTATAWSVL